MNDNWQNSFNSCYYFNLHSSAICKAAGDNYGGLRMQSLVKYSYSPIRCRWEINPAQHLKPRHAPHTCAEVWYLCKRTCVPTLVKKKRKWTGQKVMWLFWVCVCVRVCLFRWQMVRNKAEERVLCVCGRGTREILLIWEFNSTREEIKNILNYTRAPLSYCLSFHNTQYKNTK